MTTVGSKNRSINLVFYIAFLTFALAATVMAIFSWKEDLYFNLNPFVLPAYFAASVIMVLILFRDDLISNLGRKFAVVVGYSFLTRIVSIILFYPGSSGDPWYHLAVSRTWYNTGMHYFSFLPATLRELTPEIQTALGRIYIYQRAAAQQSLVVILSRILSIDVYWVHLCLLGMIWSLFIPVMAFKTSKTLGASDRASLLAAILMANAPIALAWSFLEVPNSLGFVFFAATVYFSARVLTSEVGLKYGLLAFACSVVAMLAHSLTGFVAIAVFLLAITLRTYNKEKNKGEKRAFLTLPLGLALSVMLLPLTTIGLQLLYPIKSSLSLTKFFDLGIYQIVLANYSAYTFIQGIMYGILSLLALIGILLKAKGSSEKYVKAFLALAFGVLIAQYRIFFYFIDPPPFGVHRLLVFFPFVIAPIAALAVDFFFKGFSNWSANPSPRIGSHKLTFREGLAILLVTLSLSAFFAQGILSTWEEINKRGDISIVSAYSMEAAKRIHEEYLRTGEKYVVVSDQLSEMAGIALVGRYNLNEYYMLSIGQHQNRPLFEQALSEITLEPMFTAAKDNNATIAYLVVSRWSVKWYLGQAADYSTIVNELGRQYETFAIVGSDEGEVHVFRYRVALTPTEGIGPTLRVLMDSQESYINATYTYATFDKVTYSLNLRSASTYKITDWPIFWSYESIQPTPADASIDANTWINFTATSTDMLYTVSWTANQIYPNVVWKDDSFREGWFKAGAGKATYSFTTDGDIANISVQGAARDYIIHDRQLPNLSGRLSLLVRLRFDQNTISYISLWEDAIGSEQVFFSGTIRAGEDYRTLIFVLPEDATFTRIRLIVRTPDGSPKTEQLDYIMFVEA